MNREDFDEQVETIDEAFNLVNKIYADFESREKEIYAKAYRDGWSNSGEGYNAEYGCNETMLQEMLCQDMTEWEKQDAK